MSSNISNTITIARNYLELVEKDLKGVSLNDFLELNGAQQKDLLDAIKLLEDVIGKLPETKVEVEEIKMMEITIDISSGVYKTQYPQLTCKMFNLMHCGKKIEAIEEYVKIFFVTIVEAKAACEQYYEAKRPTIPNPWQYTGSCYVAKLLD